MFRLKMHALFRLVLDEKQHFEIQHHGQLQLAFNGQLSTRFLYTNSIFYFINFNFSFSNFLFFSDYILNSDFKVFKSVFFSNKTLKSVLFLT